MGERRVAHNVLCTLRIKGVLKIFLKNQGGITELFVPQWGWMTLFLFYFGREKHNERKTAENQRGSNQKH